MKSLTCHDPVSTLTFQDAQYIMTGKVEAGLKAKSKVSEKVVEFRLPENTHIIG
jgi:hypothetical protein